MLNNEKKIIFFAFCWQLLGFGIAIVFLENQYDKNQYKKASSYTFICKGIKFIRKRIGSISDFEDLYYRSANEITYVEVKANEK